MLFSSTTFLNSLRQMVVYNKEILLNELPKHRSLFWKTDCIKWSSSFLSVKKKYCLYRLDVIIPGVTIKTPSPNVHNMTTSVDDTEPFDDTIYVPAVKTSRQDGVGVTWDKPPKDENIDSVSSWLMLIIALIAKSVFTQTLQLT